MNLLADKPLVTPKGRRQIEPNQQAEKQNVDADSDFEQPPSRTN
jgi:hypothetical protein